MRAVCTGVSVEEGEECRFGEREWQFERGSEKVESVGEEIGGRQTGDYAREGLMVVAVSVDVFGGGRVEDRKCFTGVGFRTDQVENLCWGDLIRPSDGFHSAADGHLSGRSTQTDRPALLFI